MKELLILIIFLCVMLIAYINVNYYKARQKILKELYDWLLIYKQYVSFQKMPYEEIISKTYSHMSQYMRHMTKIPISYDNMPYILDNSLKNEIVDILFNFGKSDIMREIEYVDICVSKVDKMYNNSKEEYKTKGVLRSKLIIIFGIAFLVLLI